MQHQCQIVIKPGPDGTPWIESAEGTLPENATVTVEFSEDGKIACGHLIVVNDVMIELEDSVPMMVPA